MKVETFSISGPVLLTPRRFEDARGWFMESYKADALNDALGHTVTFVQDNQSLSRQAGTVRGLHYQAPPRAQGKLVRVVSGTVLDVAVDVRRGSPTFGQHVRAELSAENGQQLWVPPGFLHGFATQAPDTVVLYKVTDVYAPDCDGAVRYDDPVLGIEWGLTGPAILSDKDAAAPGFGDWTSPFFYEAAP